MSTIAKFSIGLGLLAASVVCTPGTWSAWGAWSSDCATCTDAASMGRARVCIPASDGSNDPCEGSRIEYTSCCEDGAFNEWSEWTACSDTCGFCGTQNRTRTCGTGTTRTGCPACTEPETELSPPCDSGTICKYPRVNCCVGTKKIVGTNLVCEMPATTTASGR